MSAITQNQSVTKEVIIGWQCDQCQKRSMDLREVERRWLQFDEYHMAWGGDSWESRHSHVVCSPACFARLARKLAKELDGYAGAEVAEMPVAFLLALLDIVTLEPPEGD